LGAIKEATVCKEMILTIRYRAPEVMALGEALLYCKKCKNLWSSHNAVIEVNLTDQTITKKYKQKCKTCLIWATPLFTEDRLTTIIRQAVSKGEKGDTMRPLCNGGDHMSHLCEWCKRSN